MTDLAPALARTRSQATLVSEFWRWLVEVNSLRSPHGVGS